MKSVGSWLPRPSIIGAVRGHVLGAVAAVRSVVVVAQRARSDGSTVCRREVSRSCSRSTSGPEGRGWNVETTNLRTMGPTYDLYQLIPSLGTGPGGHQGQRGRSPDPNNVYVVREGKGLTLYHSWYTIVY